MHNNRLTELQTSFVQLTSLPSHLQPPINTITQQLGPHIAEALILNIAGDAARSELDALADPLKKMVFKQPRAKMWLEAALFGESFPSRKVGEKEKRVWLLKVMK